MIVIGLIGIDIKQEKQYNYFRANMIPIKSFKHSKNIFTDFTITF